MKTEELKELGWRLVTGERKITIQGMTVYPSFIGDHVYVLNKEDGFNTGINYYLIPSKNSKNSKMIHFYWATYSSWGSYEGYCTYNINQIKDLEQIMIWRGIIHFPATKES